MSTPPRQEPPPARANVPRVTIGVPVFNGARFLAEALDSLLAQSFRDFELIVSDNGSTDDTGSIARQYAEHDSRVRYIRHEANRGAARNCNFVFTEARAPYFKWADDDDVCAPTFLEKCVAALDADPSLVCCHARTRKIDEAGRVLEHLDDPTDGGLPTAWFTGGGTGRHRRDASSKRVSQRFGDVLLSSGWGVRCAGVMRSDVLRQTTLFKPIYGYEKVTMGELALRGRFHDLPETLFFQRVHQQASSQLASASAQQQFVGGQSTRRGQRWALLRGHLRAVRQAPLSLPQRLACWTWIGRYFLQLHKWPGIVRSALAGGGLDSHRRSSPPPAPPLEGEGRHWSDECRSTDAVAEPSVPDVAPAEAECTGKRT